jgi:hypothetical protein
VLAPGAEIAVYEEQECVGTDTANIRGAEMAVLSWRHGGTKAEASASLRAALKDAGYDPYVEWSGDTFEARSGPFASFAFVRGEVTDEAAVIHNCRGLIRGVVLARTREALARLFPGGSPVEAAM